MKNIFKIILLFLLINSSQLFACPGKVDSLKFSGKLTSTDHENEDWRLSIIYNITDNFNAKDATIFFHPKVDRAGNFQFTLPNLGKPYQFTLDVYQTTNVGYGKTIFFSNYFCTEPGDDINIDITLELDDTRTHAMNTVKFTGAGSEKYNLAWQLQEPFFNEYLQEVIQIELDKPMDSITIKEKMQKFISILKYYQTKKSNLIYSTSVNPEIRQIINYEYGAYQSGLNNEWRYRSQVLYDKYPQYRKQIATNYLLYNQVFFKKPDTIAKYCFRYIEELLKREMFKQRIRTGSDVFDIKTLYNTIKTNYSGVARERILGLILTNVRIQGYFPKMESRFKDSLLKDGLSLVKTPYIKKTLEAQIEELRNLSFKIFNGEFLDLDGKKFELKSLAGKVILLDVWFNGCFGCAEFHKSFQKIYPKFKNNKHFVVLSVNVDKDRDRWLKGIESGLYTSKDYIQVTTGNWFENTFMKYYNIRGASYVMVINQNGEVLPKANTFEDYSTQISEMLENYKSNSSK